MLNQNSSKFAEFQIALPSFKPYVEHQIPFIILLRIKFQSHTKSTNAAHVQTLKCLSKTNANGGNMFMNPPRTHISGLYDLMYQNSMIETYFSWNHASTNVDAHPSVQKWQDESCNRKQTKLNSYEPFAKKTNYLCLIPERLKLKPFKGGNPNQFKSIPNESKSTQINSKQIKINSNQFQTQSLKPSKSNLKIQSTSIQKPI